MAFFTYMLASAPYGTLYCGHTESLTARIWKHREKVFSGFTAKYGVFRLVWFEAHDTRGGAFRRERQIKKWNRAWKVRLIEAENPTWSDLYEDLVGPAITADSALYPLIPAKAGTQADSEPHPSLILESRPQLGSPPSRG